MRLSTGRGSIADIPKQKAEKSERTGRATGQARRNRVRFIKLEGVEPQSGVNNETQLTAFARQLSEQTGCDDSPLGNWFNAFARLAKTLNPREKTVLLIDEISWMGKYDVAFPGELKYAWDNSSQRIRS